MLKTILVLLGLCCSYQTMAESFNYPGGVVELRIDKQNKELPTVKYGLKDATIIDKRTYWQILVGIGLDTLPGEYLVYIKRANKEERAFINTFNIRQKPLADKEPLANKKPLAGEKPLADKKPLAHEELSDLNFSNTEQPSLPLRYPAEGNWTQDFGSMPHHSQQSGLLNYIALTSSNVVSVIAPQNAIITKIEPYQQNKNDSDEPTFSIFLDHGRGLHSIISGLSNLSVETGNGVVAGAVLGMLTDSEQNADRQSQPLLWQVMLNGVYVDPNILTNIQ